MFLFYHEIVCCVYSLESHTQCDSNENTQHTIIEEKIEKNPLNIAILPIYGSSSWKHVYIILIPLNPTFI